MSYHDKYLKYKNKYLLLKQTGGAIIYNLIKIIDDSIKDNTLNHDEPIDPFIINESITALERQVPFITLNHIDVINNSTRYNVFSNNNNTFRYIQLKYPTLNLSDTTPATFPVSYEFSNYYLCKFTRDSTQIIEGVNYNIYWLVEIMGKINKSRVSKIQIPLPPSLLFGSAKL